MGTFNEIEDLFIPNAFDDESRIDILVDTKRRLIDDQKSFKYTVSTNLDSNKYIEETELDLSIFEPKNTNYTDLQKAIHEWILYDWDVKEDPYYDYARAYRYDNDENIY